MSRPSPDDPDDDGYVPGAHDIVADILLEGGDLARLMEVFYFSLEPGMPQTVRWLASLPEDARRELGEFAAAGRHDVRIERPDAMTLVMTLARR